MKGFDAFSKPKETKIGKLIYNLKKPVKGKSLEEDEIYDINQNEYSPKAENFLTDDILYYSFEDSEDNNDHDDDAVINIKPRNRILHSISEVSLSDESIESTSPPKSPLRDFENEADNESCHYMAADGDIEMYLQPNHLQQYNYARFDATKLLDKLKNMKEGMWTHKVPLHRRRLGSTPSVLNHSQEYNDSKQRQNNAYNQSVNQNGVKVVTHNDCDCGFADKIKRSRSVGEIFHARNSSSYNKFKKSTNTGPLCTFARYIMINGVEYKVPSNVPKYDPPDLEPSPALPPKRRNTVKDSGITHLDKLIIELKDIDIISADAGKSPSDTSTVELKESNIKYSSDKERRSIKSPTMKVKENVIEEKLEELENIIKELQRREKEEASKVMDYPTYVNDSAYLDTIRQKRRQKSENQTSLFRDRFESCPSSFTSMYGNLQTSKADYCDNFAKTMPLPRANRRYEKPLVVTNCYSIPMNTPEPVKRNIKTSKSCTLKSKRDIYPDTPRKNSRSKTLPRCKTDTSSDSPSVKNNGYVYARPADRSLTELSDYQYAYAHTQHVLHPITKRQISAPTVKESPRPLYQKFQYTRNNMNTCDIVQNGGCPRYANVKCLDAVVSTTSDVNNNTPVNIDDSNLLQIPVFNIETEKRMDNNNTLRPHEYTYISNVPSAEPSKTNQLTSDSTHSLARVGSSYNKFQSKLDYLIPTSRFAKYVNVEGSDLEYKIPSNVPKFNAPELTPPSLLFKDKSNVKYDDPMHLSFSIDDIDEIISQLKTT